MVTFLSISSRYSYSCKYLVAQQHSAISSQVWVYFTRLPCIGMQVKYIYKWSTALFCGVYIYEEKL